MAPDVSIERKVNLIQPWSFYDLNDDGWYGHLFENPEDDAKMIAKMEEDLLAA